MAAVFVQGASDFWSRAPSLFDEANDVGRSLESDRMTAAADEWLRRLASALTEEPDGLRDADPYLTSALLTSVIQGLQADDADDRRSLRIAVERIRQSLRDLLDEQPVWVGGPKHAALWLRDQGLSVDSLSELLHVSDSTVRRWSNPDDPTEPSDETADRVVMLAKIVNHLRHAMTPRGVVQWLQRPHPALDGRRPVDELKDATSYTMLVNLASGARSFHPT